MSYMTIAGQGKNLEGSDSAGFRMNRTPARPSGGRPLQNPLATRRRGLVAPVPSRVFQDGTGLPADRADCVPLANLKSSHPAALRRENSKLDAEAGTPCILETSQRPGIRLWCPLRFPFFLRLPGRGAAPPADPVRYVRHQSEMAVKGANSAARVPEVSRTRLPER